MLEIPDRATLENICNKLDRVTVLLEAQLDDGKPNVMPEPTDLQLMVPTREAAKMLSISERTLYSITKAGLVGRVKVGVKNLYPVEELKRYVKENMAIG